MTQMSRNRFSAALISLILLLAPSASIAQTQTQRIVLSPDEMRIIAQYALESGDPQQAAILSEAMIARDGTDVGALLIRAQSALALNTPDLATSYAQRAWRHAPAGTARYFAGRVASVALASQDKFTRAQLWLRRSSIHAPNDETYQQNARDYAALRRANPWNVRLMFGLAPSSNLNGGSSGSAFEIDGLNTIGQLSGDAQALSGWAATADAQISYRLSTTATQRTDLRARFYARNIYLSQDAKTTAPDVENTDFSTRYVEFGPHHQRRLGDGALVLNARIGGNWFGGDLQYPFYRVAFERHHDPRPNGLTLYYTGSLEHRSDPDHMGLDETASRISIGTQVKVFENSRLDFDLSQRHVDTDDSNIQSFSTRAVMTFRPGEPIGPARTSFSLGYEHQYFPDYTVLIPVPDGRSDNRIFGSAEFMFPDMTYAGFAPVVTLNASQADSNVSRFDRSELSVGFSFRSTF